MIVLWTVFIGAAHTTVVEVTAVGILNNVIGDIVICSASIVYAVLAFVTMLYPLIGFVADAICGRFKVVISCFSLVLFSCLIVHA